MSNLPPVVDSLVLAIVPAWRSLLDQSPGARTVTQAGSGLKWVRKGWVDQLLAESTGRLVVANDAELQAVTDFSLFCAGEVAPSAAQLLYKGDAGGLQIDLYKDNGTEIEINDGSNTRVADIGPWAGVRSFCGTFESGAIGDLYRNGAWESVFDGVTTITGDNADVTLLNYYTGVTPWLGTASALLWYSRVLTADENAQLHAWSESLASPTIPHDRRYFDLGSSVPNGDAGGVVGAWDLGTVTRRTVSDSSGNSLHGTLVGACAPVNTEAGRALGFDGATGYVDIGATGQTLMMVELVVKIAGNAKILDLDGGTHTIEVAAGSLVATGFASPTYYVDGVATAVVPDGWHHVAVTTGTGVAATNMDIGRVGASYGGHTIQSVRLNSGVLTLAEIKADALKLAQRVQYRFALQQVRPTLAPITAGQTIPGTDYRVESGSFAITEDANDKYLECVSTGSLSSTKAPTGQGGSMELRRNGTDWGVLLDAAQPTDLNLITGDQIRLIHSTLRPLYQHEGYFTWTTTDTTQNWTVRADVGAAYWIDWGDGTVDSYTGNGANQAVAHTYGAAGTYTVGFLIEDAAALVILYCNSNSLTGSIPDLSANTALSTLYCNSNSLTGSIPDLSANTALVTLLCYSNSLTGSIPDLSANTALTTFYCYSNSLTGSIPDLSANTGLLNFRCYGNSLTGSIPDLSANTALANFRCYSNSLTGSIPDLSANTSLLYFYCNTNALTGSIPDLSSNTALVRFYCYTNSLTGYTASTISATCIDFNASTNALSLAAVDQILTDFTTGAAGRPAAGTINLSGGTNATPTPAVLSTILLALPGWTITTN